ncbi:hypothetical protein GVAV_001384 [Gurleya vavrai]
MHNKFPKLEIPAFEEHYGKTHKDAFPIPNSVCYNLKQEQSAIKLDTPVNIPAYTKWFHFDSINEIEIMALSTITENQELYKENRNALIEYYRNEQKFVTFKIAREITKCNVTDCMKIYVFLQKWGLINFIFEKNKIIDYKNVEIKNSVKNVTEQNLDFDRINCKFCEKNVENNLYYFNTIVHYFICFECYETGNYENIYSISDFTKFEDNHFKNIWTDKDDFLLLQMVGESNDWDLISKDIGKPKEHCILRYLKINIKSIYKDNLNLVDENVFNFTFNPIMNYITFLCGSVHPKLASEVAKYCINNLKAENKISNEIISVAANTAKEQLVIEEKKIVRLHYVLADLQHKKLELKLGEFEELMRCVGKERKEYEFARETYIKEFEDFKKDKK